MKGKFTILALSMLALAACSKPEPEVTVPEPNGLTIVGLNEQNEKAVAFKNVGGEETIQIEVKGPWEAVLVKECDWLTIDPTFGEEAAKKTVDIKLTAAENEAFEAREAELVFTCDGNDAVGKVKISQGANVKRSIKLEHAKALAAKEGATFTVKLALENITDWSATSSETWATVAKEGADQIKVTCAANGDNARKAEVTVAAKIDGKDYSAKLEVSQAGKLALPELFCLQINDDGTAKDVSPKNNTVYFHKKTKETETDPTTVKIVKDPKTKVNAAIFNGGTKEGSQTRYGFYPTAGYTFASYALRPEIQTGYTMEAYLMCSVEPTAGKESKAFSSTNGGGTALMMGTDQVLSFLYCGKPDGSKWWNWVRSGIIPKPNQWYHVIGTWDQASGIARIFVDGKLMNETNYGPVKLYLNQHGENSYTTIGGNSSGAKPNPEKDPGAKPNTAETPDLNGAWIGGVAVANIYNRALSIEEAMSHSFLINGEKFVLYDKFVPKPAEKK